MFDWKILSGEKMSHANEDVRRKTCFREINECLNLIPADHKHFQLCMKQHGIIVLDDLVKFSEAGGPILS